MQIPLTMPLETTDGRNFGEVYLLLDVRVTVKATSHTSWSPAEGPEWIVEGVEIELGKWDFKSFPSPTFTSDTAPVPAWLVPAVNHYIDSKDGHYEIAEQIQDGGY